MCWQLLFLGMMLLDSWKLCHTWERIGTSTPVEESRMQMADRWVSSLRSSSTNFSRCLWLLEGPVQMLTQRSSYTRQRLVNGPMLGLLDRDSRGLSALREPPHWRTGCFWRADWTLKRPIRPRWVKYSQSTSSPTIAGTGTEHAKPWGKLLDTGEMIRSKEAINNCLNPNANPTKKNRPGRKLGRNQVGTWHHFWKPQCHLWLTLSIFIAVISTVRCSIPRPDTIQPTYSITVPDLSLTHSLNSVCVLVVLLVFVLKVICIQYAIGITGNLSGWFVLKRLQKADVRKREHQLFIYMQYLQI